MSALDLDAIARRWSADGGMGNPRSADDYSNVGCRLFAEHAFRDVPALINELRVAHATIDRVRNELDPWEAAWIPGRPQTHAGYELLRAVRAGLDPQEKP